MSEVKRDKFGIIKAGCIFPDKEVFWNLNKGDLINHAISQLGKKDELLKRWLKLIRDPNSENVNLLERETAIEVGELDPSPEQG